MASREELKQQIAKLEADLEEARGEEALARTKAEERQAALARARGAADKARTTEDALTRAVAQAHAEREAAEAAAAEISKAEAAAVEARDYLGAKEHKDRALAQAEVVGRLVSEFEAVTNRAVQAHRVTVKAEAEATRLTETEELANEALASSQEARTALLGRLERELGATTELLANFVEAATDVGTESSDDSDDDDDDAVKVDEAKAAEPDAEAAQEESEATEAVDIAEWANRLQAKCASDDFKAVALGEGKHKSAAGVRLCPMCDEEAERQAAHTCAHQDFFDATTQAFRLFDAATLKTRYVERVFADEVAREIATLELAAALKRGEPTGKKACSACGATSTAAHSRMGGCAVAYLAMVLCRAFIGLPTIEVAMSAAKHDHLAKRLVDLRVAAGVPRAQAGKMPRSVAKPVEESPSKRRRGAAAGSRYDVESARLLAEAAAAVAEARKRDGEAVLVFAAKSRLAEVRVPVHQNGEGIEHGGEFKPIPSFVQAQLKRRLKRAASTAQLMETLAEARCICADEPVEASGEEPVDEEAGKEEAGEEEAVAQGELAAELAMRVDALEVKMCRLFEAAEERAAERHRELLAALGRASPRKRNREAYDEASLSLVDSIEPSKLAKRAGGGDVHWNSSLAFGGERGVVSGALAQ